MKQKGIILLMAVLFIIVSITIVLWFLLRKKQPNATSENFYESNLNYTSSSDQNQTNKMSNEPFFEENQLYFYLKLDTLQPYVQCEYNGKYYRNIQGGRPGVYKIPLKKGEQIIQKCSIHKMFRPCKSSYFGSYVKQIRQF